MRNSSEVSGEVYIKRGWLRLEDFLFFSLYSFSCLVPIPQLWKYFRALVLSWLVLSRAATPLRIPSLRKTLHPCRLRSTLPVTNTELHCLQLFIRYISLVMTLMLEKLPRAVVVRGSPLAAVMIHVWTKQIHVLWSKWHAYAKHLSAKYVNMFVSQVVLSGTTLEPRVDQLVTATVALADSGMMTQLCRHYCEVKNLQQCA
jgi:hypothetical protein